MTVPSMLSHYSNLIKLSLGYNRLSVIPSFLVELPFLSDVDFSQNPITSIPSTFANFQIQIDGDRICGMSESYAAGWFS